MAEHNQTIQTEGLPIRKDGTGQPSRHDPLIFFRGVEMANPGFFLINRKIWDNPIAQKPNYLSVWMYLISCANYTEKKAIINNRAVVIKRGQLLTSRITISDATGVSQTTVERILNYLESEQQIGQQKHNKFRLITVTNYEKYQKSDTKMDNKRTTDGQQTDTPNKDNKDNKTTLPGEPGPEDVFSPKASESLRKKQGRSSLLNSVVEYFTLTFEGKYGFRPTVSWGAAGKNLKNVISAMEHNNISQDQYAFTTKLIQWVFDNNPEVSSINSCFSAYNLNRYLATIPKTVTPSLDGCIPADSVTNEEMLARQTAYMKKLRGVV